MPASYVLQPISDLLPAYLDHSNIEVQKDAKSTWGIEYELMYNALSHVAPVVLKDENRVLKYKISGNIYMYSCNIHSSK